MQLEVKVEPYSFNLVDKPWIPVRIEGRLELLSLEQTLLRAGEIERLEDASPLVVVALHRLLLAVLYRALHGPATLEDNAKWLEDGQFPVQPIRAYLERWKPHFDLFDSKRPFLQVADLHTAKFGERLIEPKSWIELVPEIKDGGAGAPILNHENHVAEPIEPAFAARTLLTRLTFALTGLSRSFVYTAKSSPSPTTPFIIPHGESLLATLCYCLDPNNFTLYKYDIPEWEKEKALAVAELYRLKEQEVMGCAQAYTWMSRSVKLIPAEIDHKLSVERIYFASGIAAKFSIENYYDPMVASQIAQYGAKKGQFVFKRFRKGRHFWRDFDSLVSQSSSNFKPPRVISLSSRLYEIHKKDINLGVYGIANPTQEAKVDFSRHERYLLPEAISADRTSEVYSSLEDALRQAEDIGKALEQAAESLARKLLSHGDRKLERGDVTKLVDSFPTYAAYWSALDNAFPKLLERLTVNYRWDEVSRFWQDQLLSASNRAWSLTREAAGDDAFALRAIYSAQGLLLAAQKPLRPKESA